MILPEEQELLHLESKQAALEDQVATAELMLETLKAESVRFQHYYYQTIGRLYVELDWLNLQIAKIQAGDELLNAALEAAQQQALKSAAELGAIEVQPTPVKITPELKQLFRQAAKLMHPDRATTDAERERRTGLMAQVNVAYAKGDQATIEKLMIEFGQDPEAIIGEDVASRLVKVIRRIAQLNRRLNEAQHEIATQKSGELFELMKTLSAAKKSGRGDLLADLAKHIQQQILQCKQELDLLKRRSSPVDVKWDN